MKKFSFIDNQKKDFLRDEENNVIIIEGEYYIVAEDWLLQYGKKYGWTNTGHHLFEWAETFKEANLIILKRDKEIILEKINDVNKLFLDGTLDKQSYNSVHSIYAEILKKIEKGLQN